MKFGFENGKISIPSQSPEKWSDAELTLTVVEDGCSLLGESCESEIEILKPKYVHQLQNLYFALTGEELTIKETETA